MKSYLILLLFLTYAVAIVSREGDRLMTYVFDDETLAMLDSQSEASPHAKVYAATMRLLKGFNSLSPEEKEQQLASLIEQIGNIEASCISGVTPIIDDLEYKTNNSVKKEQ